MTQLYATDKTDGIEAINHSVALSVNAGYASLSVIAEAVEVFSQSIKGLLHSNTNAGLKYNTNDFDEYKLVPTCPGEHYVKLLA